MKQLYWNIYVRVWSWIRSVLDITLGTKFYRDINKHLEAPADKLIPLAQSDEEFRLLFRSGFPWGDYHPKNPHQWWGGVPVSRFLYSKAQEKTIDGLLIPYRADVLQSKDSYGYGLYELLVDLHPSEWDWMAFWLFSEDGKAEIDIFEFYTDPLAETEKFESTVHWGGNYGTPEHTRTRAISSYVSRSSRNPARFSLFWTPWTIDIYYNGALARRIVDERVLSEMWGKKMKVIINAGVMPEKAQFASQTTSVMVLKEFQYIPLKNN